MGIIVNYEGHADSEHNHHKGLGKDHYKVLHKDHPYFIFVADTADIVHGEKIVSCGEIIDVEMI